MGRWSIASGEGASVPAQLLRRIVIHLRLEHLLGRDVQQQRRVLIDFDPNRLARQRADSHRWVGRGGELEPDTLHFGAATQLLHCLAKGVHLERAQHCAGRSSPGYRFQLCRREATRDCVTITHRNAQHSRALVQQLKLTDVLAGRPLVVEGQRPQLALSLRN